MFLRTFGTRFEMPKHWFGLLDGEYIIHNPNQAWWMERLRHIPVDYHAKSQMPSGWKAHNLIYNN